MGGAAEVNAAYTIEGEERNDDRLPAALVRQREVRGFVSRLKHGYNDFGGTSHNANGVRC
jgi:hypothetical protein